MGIRVAISLVIFATAGWLVRYYQLPVDILFVLLIFLTFKSESTVWPLAGIVYLIFRDHLFYDFIPFYTVGGLIIFASACWLRTYYPIFKKLLSLVMVPLYTQFLWFVLLFGFFVNEGASSHSSRYLAPFIAGNFFMACVFGLIFYQVLKPRRGREFNRRLLL